MNSYDTPYRGLPSCRWEQKTRALVRAHPLDMDEIVKVVLKVWTDILTLSIGSKPFKIGSDLFPAPQVMSFFLHELIPLELARLYPGVGREEKSSNEKALVFVPARPLSFDVLSPRQILG